MLTTCTARVTGETPSPPAMDGKTKHLFCTLAHSAVVNFLKLLPEVMSKQSLEYQVWKLVLLYWNECQKSFLIQILIAL